MNHVFLILDDLTLWDPTNSETPFTEINDIEKIGDTVTPYSRIFTKFNNGEPVTYTIKHTSYLDPSETLLPEDLPEERLADLANNKLKAEAHVVQLIKDLFAFSRGEANQTVRLEFQRRSLLGPSVQSND